MQDYRVITPEDKEYPALLKEISNPPERLYLKGEILPEGPYFGIVGTRKPTAYGKEAAAEFAKNLAGHGFTIVSGLAFGIDAASHQAAIEAGGRTLAVLPCGIGHVAPRSHTALAKEIEAHGTLLSEFEPDEEARPEFFPQRNRIISGLAIGVLVIEAPINSGALITARHAAEQNRDVFVIPGPIFSKNFAGSHRLIQEGAKLTQNIDDILEEYADLHQSRLAMTPARNIEMSTYRHESSKDDEDNETKTVMAMLEETAEPLARDEIGKRTGLEPKTLQAILTMLELKGKVRRLPDDTFQAR